MAKIALSESNFSVVPEGTHIFQITDVQYKEDFGKLNITMKTREGYTHIERFAFVKSNGEPNEVALGVFSTLAKIALQDFDLDEIDHTDLIGHFIKCEVKHDVQPNKNDPTKTITFSRLGEKAMANGFDDDAPVTLSKPAAAPVAPKATPKSAPAVAPTSPAATAPKKVDLAAILGRK